MISQELISNLGGKVRVRVMGLLVIDDRLLMVKHKNIQKDSPFWSPPGGGVNFSENASEALIREFREETNITVTISKFLFVNHFRNKHFNALELFFAVEKTSGELDTGIDPEFKEQIISEAKYLKWKEIDLIPENEKHNAFRYCENPQEITELSGFYEFQDI